MIRPIATLAALLLGLTFALPSLAQAPRKDMVLKGSYALNKASGVRLMYVYDRFKTDDWYWTVYPAGTTYAYADGTSVTEDPDQEVHFIGVSYYHRFR